MSHRFCLSSQNDFLRLEQAVESIIAADDDDTEIDLIVVPPDPAFVSDEEEGGEDDLVSSSLPRDIPGTIELTRRQPSDEEWDSSDDEPLSNLYTKTYQTQGHRCGGESLAPLLCQCDLTLRRLRSSTLQLLFARTAKDITKQLVGSKNEQNLVKQIKNLKTKNISYKMKLQKALKLSTNITFQTALKKFKTLAALFTVMQFREIAKPKMGRRFTKEEKIMALSVYKMGPKAYRWLSKIFVLPSPVTLSRMVSQASLKSGINDNIFNQLKKKIGKMNEHKLCTLIFDEMALSPHMDFNPKKDRISGFVNHNGESSRKIADHALVFMIRGIMKNYKQPIYYSFCSGSTPKEILAA
ncbi:hypothetical protein PYW08_006047 [Mythimna loreyi]|uniref:Uncharacterized protein n=1 Tax=Mythimna loreyi TaxID=667449 RepID=A0ACC2QLJ5_9NEOP|nr:hypothetical protein PYW08_006047 [Mythimna loreyi]